MKTNYIVNDNSSEPINEILKNLLVQIEQVWNDLNQEPKGTYTVGYVLLPPSQYNYWKNLEKLNDLVLKINKDFSNLVVINYSEFFHTMHKEGEYVRDYTYNTKLSEFKNNERLSALMVEANRHIYRDLYTIFQLINTIKNSK